MTRDPIQPLADTGRRVLQTVRYLAMPPVPEQPLESYENRSRDPVLALSGLCDELLRRLSAAPLEAEPEYLPKEPESRFVRAPSPGSALTTLSPTGAAQTRVPADGRDETAGSPSVNQAGPGLDDASPFEQPRRSIERPTPSQYEPAGAATHRDKPPEPPLRPAMDGTDGQTAARRRARSAPPSRYVQHPVGPEGEPYEEERDSETRSPARQLWPEHRQTESPSDALASGVPARAENGSARGAGESDVSLPGSRLTGSTERLAAMLRSHVAQPESFTRAAEERDREGEDVPSSRQGEDERGAADEPGRSRPAGRAGMEEIMERLADELETGFVRTYGRTGG